MKIVIRPPVEPDRRAALRAAAPGAEWVNAPDAALARGAMPGADAFLGKITPELLAAAGRLRWVQAFIVSLEHYIFPELVAHPCTLTSRLAPFGAAGLGSFGDSGSAAKMAVGFVRRSPVGRVPRAVRRPGLVGSDWVRSARRIGFVRRFGHFPRPMCLPLGNDRLVKERHGREVPSSTSSWDEPSDSRKSSLVPEIGFPFAPEALRPGRWILTKNRPRMAPIAPIDRIKRDLLH